MGRIPRIDRFGDDQSGPRANSHFNEGHSGSVSPDQDEGMSKCQEQESAVSEGEHIPLDLDDDLEQRNPGYRFEAPLRHEYDCAGLDSLSECEQLQVALLRELAEIVAFEQAARAAPDSETETALCDEAQNPSTHPDMMLELETLRVALSREQLETEQAWDMNDSLQAALARERHELARIRSLQEQLKRERAELQTIVDEVLRRVDETGVALRVAARQAALIDVVLERARSLLARKSKRGRSHDDLTLALEQLARLRSNLDTLVGLTASPELDRDNAAPNDRNRILPGRSALTAKGTARRNGAVSNGHHPKHLFEPALASNGREPSSGQVTPVLPVDIIICVYNALDDVRRCPESVVRHTAVPYRLIIVDDGSDAETAAYLQHFTKVHEHVLLLRNHEPSGYTKAANQGLRAAIGAEIVLLNSDTIVTRRWLEHLLACLHSDSNIGIAGPLSNAASYQSVPERYDPGGDWALNPVPPGWNIDQIAAAVTQIATFTFPRVPFVNGFCLAIKRAVIEAIGYFDEERFPEGYGEENDFCLRAADAGFALAIADQAYVYHAKSRSFTHARRRALGKSGRAKLLDKYGSERLAADEARLREEPTLASIRASLSTYLKNASRSDETSNLSVLFLLPVGGGGGGAHSVVQEAMGMRRLGITAQVAIRAMHLDRYRQNYPGVSEREELFFAYRSPDELEAHAAHFAVVVATIYSSMPLLAEISAHHPHVLPAYYIQDYEPFFYPEGSAGRAEAARSYTLIPHAVLFAKTRWLCETVAALHNVHVHKVSPSLDHAVYFPLAGARHPGPARVVAMIRPSSARRGAGRTMQVLRRLATTIGKKVEIHIFGCSDADLESARLRVDFPFINHGVLTRERVAAILRQSDIFLDLSDYQAFGRTGLEAMASGCAVVLPALGGASEYAIHGENALLVDTSSVDICYQAAHALVTHDDARRRLQRAGRAKAAEYSIALASSSEIELFTRELQSRPKLGLGSSRRPSEAPRGFFFQGAKR